MKTCTNEYCRRPAWARGLCAPHYSTWHRAQKKYTLTCEGCGQDTQAQRKGARFCSRKCANSVNQAKATAQAAKVRTKPRPLVLYTGPPYVRPMTEVHTAHRLTSGRCRTCSQWFVSFNLDVTCSPECWTMHNAEQRRLAHARRRARKRNAYVADVYRKLVFERDGYRCHLCKKKTRPDKQVPHPKAPTIDHVIPLAAGGTHEPLNCRTACYLCNCKKSHGGGGEQLLLIA